MKKARLTRTLMAAVSIVALSAVMYGCVHNGDGDDSTSTDMTDMQPTPYEKARDAIVAADTAEAAQKAYDDVKGDVTAEQGEKLQMAVDARVAALAKMGRVDDQKMALMTAAGMIDTSDEALSTQEGVDAARTAIAALRGAIAAAVDVDDTSMYESQLTAAEGAVDTAQGGIDTATRRSNQMMALSDASDDLQAALAALSGATPTQAQLDAANNALTALNGAITDAADLTDAEKATYQREAGNAAAPIRMAQTAKDKADKDVTDATNAAMAATAAKLYAGISAPMGGIADTTNTTRAAAYSGTGDAEITVNIGDGTDARTSTLMENKKAMVAENRGWKGKMYADPAGGDMVEAVVYSNVEDLTEGRKFGSAAAATGDDREFEYQLDAEENTELTITSAADTDVQARIASPSFDQGAGKKEFELGTNMVRVMIPGSYHSVSGTYNCAPTTGETCSATVAASGFILGNGTWTFKPGNPNARVMSAMDTMYASYGWWLHKAADGKKYTASAFFDYKGGDGSAELASSVNTLHGSATYMGGAAGKYALSSSTGGTNDAGHFTARAMLKADFTDNMISGTIDTFMGADGMARDWTVELMDQAVSATGRIAGDGTAGNTDRQMTKWTIGGTAGGAGGEWNGQLYNNGDDGVPMTAAGQFFSTYGQGNSMVGAFGADKQ